jgi:hypothetical protein
MMLDPHLASSVIVVASRRRTPRIAPGEQINVEIVTVLVPAEVIDLGFGGFSVETRCSLRVGGTYRFRFNTANGRTVELNARVIHCRRKAADDWSERYVTGCEFLHDPEAPIDMIVDELIEGATNTLSFE